MNEAVNPHPTVYRVTADPGKLRNTRTGTRTAINNETLAEIYNERIAPFRREFIHRREFEAIAPWRANVTKMAITGINNIRKDVLAGVDRNEFDPTQSLADMQKQENDFRAKALNPETDFKALAEARPEANPLDPVRPQKHILRMDITGNSANEAQPTEGLLTNSYAQEFVTKLDMMVFDLSWCASSDLPDLIIPDDAFLLIKALGSLYGTIVKGSKRTSGFLPTQVFREDYDTLTNADGAYDHDHSEGRLPVDQNERTTRDNSRQRGSATPTRRES